MSTQPAERLNPLAADLARRLEGSAAPVERDLAAMLRAPAPDADQAFRLARYQRKIDVAHRLFVAYDEGVLHATTERAAGADACLALALLCARQGLAAPGRGERLRWWNSAFNALDACEGAAGREALAALLEEALPAALEAAP